VQEAWHPVERALVLSEGETILRVLSLVDQVSTGAPATIAIFSGCENFVSKIDRTQDRGWPEWMGPIDFTALKIELLGSIVAISAIQLLKKVTTIGKADTHQLFWYAVFVVSNVLLALSDRLSGDIATKPYTPPGRRAAIPMPDSTRPFPGLEEESPCKHPSTAFA
jgi:uncharacterized protein (TIGR00645 family)